MRLPGYIIEVNESILYHTKHHKVLGSSTMGSHAAHSRSIHCIVRLSCAIYLHVPIAEVEDDSTCVSHPIGLKINTEARHSY